MVRRLALCLGLLWGMASAGVGWAQTLARSDVEAAVDMQVRAMLEGAGNGAYIVALSCPTELKVPDGEVTWGLGEGIEHWEAGRHTVPVTVFVEGATAGRVTVTVTVKQRVHTPVLSRDFKRGELVGQGDVQLREVELSTPVPGRLRGVEAVVGKVATRDLRAGQPVQEKWLEGQVAVERGDRVRVTLLRGGLKIETSGVAMQRGRIGSFISVRNLQSKSLFDAQITAPGEVMVRAW